MSVVVKKTPKHVEHNFRSVLSNREKRVKVTLPVVKFLEKKEDAKKNIS